MGQGLRQAGQFDPGVADHQNVGLAAAVVRQEGQPDLPLFRRPGQAAVVSLRLQPEEEVEPRI